MTVVKEQKKYLYTTLKEPIPITEQKWPEGTMPLVHTRTMTYMHEGFIRDCIEGILMQKTTFPVRVLIHDDASTDKTPSIVREYEERYPHLISACYQNENTYRMKREEKVRRKKPFMNLCVGKYEAICEGDDYWTDPLKLQKQVSFMEDNEECSLCFHNALVVYQDINKSNQLFKKLESRFYSMGEILQEWTIPTASVLYRREHYKKIKTNSRNYMHGDIVIFLTLAESGKLWCINEVMSVYRRHEGGVTSHSMSTTQWRKKFIKHHEEIRNNFLRTSDIENSIISNNYMFLSKNQIKDRNIEFALSIYKSFINKPSSFISNIIDVYIGVYVRKIIKKYQKKSDIEYFR